MMEPENNSILDLEIRIFPKQDLGYPVYVKSGDGRDFGPGFLSSEILPWSLSADLAVVGQRLFNALLANPELRQAWNIACGKSEKHRIRLWIDVDAPELHILPWELLRDDDLILAADARTPFSRYLPTTEPWGRPVVAFPIRVLAIIANPADLDLHNLVPLDVEQERKLLQEAFADLSLDRVYLEFLAAPVTLERLEHELQQNYHILHFVGHGTFNQQREQAALYFQDDAGNTQVVSDDDFIAMLMRQTYRPHLIFLAACQTAAPSTHDAFAGLGPKLSRAGVPAVITMQDAISIDSARTLSKVFYRDLSVHGAVDRALNAARSALLTRKRFDAAVPVLYMRLKDGALWDSEPQRIDPPPKPTLPLGESSFVGRKGTLGDLTVQLRAVGAALISGMSGVGKTALATHLVYRTTSVDRIFWHTFDAEGVEGALWKMAGFLYWRKQPALWEMLESARRAGGERPPVQLVLDHLLQLLRKGNFMLCFDDWQVVVDDPLLPPFVERLQRALAERVISLIVISRRALDILPAIDSLLLRGLSLSDTHGLLIAHDLALPDAQVAELYTRTEGNAQLLVLALDILKRTTTPQRVLAQLAQEDDIERYLLQEVDAGLTETEREVMVTTAVLLGQPATRDAIEAVAERDRLKPAIRALQNRNLLALYAQDPEPLYIQHAMVRAFYYDLLGQRERRTLHQRAGEYYEAEEPDTLRAATHFLYAGDSEHAAELATSDATALMNQGHARPLRGLLEHVVKATLPLSLVAQVHLALGDVYVLQGDNDPAEMCYEAALAALATLPEDTKVRKLEAQVCRGMGDLLRDDDPTEALNWLHRGIDAVRETAPKLHADLLVKVSTAQIFIGDFQAALESVQRALSLLPPKEESWTRMGALINLGTIYAETGDRLRAVEISQQALVLAERLHAQVHQIIIWNNLALRWGESGKWSEAMDAYQRAFDLAEALGATRYQGPIMLNSGVLLLQRGEYEAARARFTQSLALAQENDLQLYELDCQANLADLYLRQSKLEEAEAALLVVERLIEETDTQDRLSETHRFWALWHLVQGALPEALQNAEKAVTLAQEMEMPLEEGIAGRVLGRALMENGQTESALQAFACSLALLEEQDPYETARTQHQWGLALRDVGDVQTAIALLQTAQATFARLGVQNVQTLFTDEDKPE